MPIPKPAQAVGALQNVAKPQQQKPNTALGTTQGLLKPVQQAAGMKPILPLKPKNTTGKYGPQSMGQQQKPVSKALRMPSKAAERVSLVGGKFGRIPRSKKEGPGMDLPVTSTTILGFSGGATAGAVGSSVATHKTRKKNVAQIKANSVQQGKNTRTINAAGRKALVEKARGGKVHLITDVGTFAGHRGFHGNSGPLKPKQRVLSRRTKGVLGVTAAFGAVSGASHGPNQIKAQDQTMARQQKKLDKQKAIIGKSLSAFGVNHG